MAYASRSFYGLLLLAAVATTWVAYFHPEWLDGPQWQARAYTTADLPRFAEITFAALAGLQLVLVVLHVPSLIAGAIVDEWRRKTLHDLLTTRLSGLEIVLGKLGARMLDLAVILGVALPILSLLTLLGGIDPRLVLLGTAATFSTAFFVAGMAILVSVHARGVNEAVIRTYGLVALWLVVPLVLRLPVVSTWPPAAARAVGAINECIAPTSPPAVIWDSLLRGLLIPGRPVATLADGLVEMIGYQAAYGLLFVALAAWRLRPAFRRHEDRRPARPWWRPGRPAPRRDLPACGDAPMLWKERYAARSGPVARWLVRLGLLVVAAFVLPNLGWRIHTWEMAIDEILVYGWGPEPSPPGTLGYFPNWTFRHAVEWDLLVLAGILCGAWMLSVACGAAVGVSGEREQGTWDALALTSLTPREIVRAKMFGAAWGVRKLAIGLFVVWALDLGLGILHPVGLVLAASAWAAFTWFAAALGTFYSLRTRSSSRALAQTVRTLLLLHAPLVAPGPIRALGYLISPPTALPIFMISYRQAPMLWYVITHPATPDSGIAMLVGILAVPATYAAAAWVLTRVAVARFDAWDDRVRPRASDRALAGRPASPRPARTPMPCSPAPSSTSS
jgi:hypothetical protein